MYSANTTDVPDIKVAVRKIRLYDSEDGNKEVDAVRGIGLSVCKDTWFASIYIPAITGPIDAPMR
jgi:hypothetical protein